MRVVTRRTRTDHVVMGSPMLLRVARELERRELRGGTALLRLARRWGMLAQTARYRLDRGIVLDVPLWLRALDETDVRTYEEALVGLFGEALERMRAPVTLFDCGADFGLVALKLVARC